MPMSRPVALAIAALPFAAALGLYATGTLQRIDDAIEARFRFRLTAPPPGPTRSLEHYAGRWQREGIPSYGTEWVARVIVRTEGKRAWMRLWHECRPNYCEQGEFEAEVYGKPPDAVHTLRVVRKRGKDVLWVVSLHPNGGDPDSLVILDERRARDPQKHPMDNQSSMTGLRRVR
jgi:hypothetical protein